MQHLNIAKKCFFLTNRIAIVVFLFCILIIGILSFSYSNNSEKLLAKKISIDIKGVDAKEFFRIISIKSNIAIVASKQVTGRVTFFVNETSLKDILDVICVAQDFAYEYKDDIVIVMSSNEYEKMYGESFNERRVFQSFKLNYANPENVVNTLNQVKSEIGKVVADSDSGTILLVDIPQKVNLMKKIMEDLDQPLKTLIVDLGYIDAIELKEYISNFLTPNVGKIVVDERNNKAVIYDLPQRIEKISQLIPVFDEKSREVIIDTRILQVTLNRRYQQGIEWERLYDHIDNLNLGGTFNLIPALTSSAQVNIGEVTGDGYDIILEFLETHGDTKIISNSRIVVLNNHEAKIMIGSREAYVTQTLSQAKTTTISADSIEFIDVGVKLSVTPTINKEGFITMKIKPEISSVGDTLETVSGSVIPIVDTIEAETVVKVKDGIMIMIAGLIKEERRDSKLGMPFFLRFPLIRHIGGSRDKQKEVTELVIFLTPHLIDGESNIDLVDIDKAKNSDTVNMNISSKAKGIKYINKN